MGKFKYILKKVLITSVLPLRKDLTIDPFSEINYQAYKGLVGDYRYKIVISKSTVIGNVKIGIGCKLQGVECVGNISLGRFVSLNGPATRVSSRLEGIEIGSFSSIASNVVIQEDYHRYNKVSSYFMNKNIFDNNIQSDIYSKGKIKIEQDVWIGSNSVVLSGVTVGRGSIIGAGSIVTKDIEPYSIVAGNPAKMIKKRFSEETIKRLEDSKWWTWDIEKIRAYKDDFLKDISSEENRNVFTHNGEL